MFFGTEGVQIYLLYIGPLTESILQIGVQILGVLMANNAKYGAKPNMAPNRRWRQLRSVTSRHVLGCLSVSGVPNARCCSDAHDIVDVLL